MALVQLCGLRAGGAFHNFWTVLKLALIVDLHRRRLRTRRLASRSRSRRPRRFPLVASAPFAISLVFVMYSYSGWNAATYIAGELRDPARNLPRALFAGTAIVIVLYVLLNAVFLATTPMAELAGQIDVAVVSGRHMFGRSGGRVRRRADHVWA